MKKRTRRESIVPFTSLRKKKRKPYGNTGEVFLRGEGQTAALSDQCGGPGGEKGQSEPFRKLPWRGKKKGGRDECIHDEIKDIRAPYAGEEIHSP